MGRRRTTVPTAENNLDPFTFQITSIGRCEIRLLSRVTGGPSKVLNAMWKRLEHRLRDFYSDGNLSPHGVNP